ncbi:flagellar motor control protein ZomB [Nocardia inohanensis]|uniref:flagellar motor control protein ZomB n=1 Tax=Nocardia inohanensis TaxID=209246 RepID=UPI00082A71E2|nr:flagellar motor control protein ZomB [Nocardia inohanensis]
MTLTRSPVVRAGEQPTFAPRIPRWPRTARAGGIVLTAALFAAGGWQRRWIADDGLTVLRTVRNLLAGNGPVFNAGERVEVNTSTAWTYLIWFFGWLTQARLEYVALFLALTLSVAAILFAMLGSARLWGGRGLQLLLPAGALVYIAIPAARDYATSGLESSLVICWLAVLWWWLIRWSQTGTVRAASLFGLTCWAGLAPLIRPEMTLLGTPALLMLWCAPLPRTRLRPWAFHALLGTAGGLLPVGYQIWRMGYYGLPYPNTAVAKDASAAKWGQGCDYLWNLIGPYWLWVPLLALAVAALATARGRIELSMAARPSTGAKPAVRVRRWLRTPSAVVALMIAGGLLLTVYEVRVGGDFMHARMLLPQLFCLLLPVMVFPLPRRADSILLTVSVALAATAGWILFAAGTTAIDTPNGITATGIADERRYYVLTTGHAHPILAEDYLDYPRMRGMLRVLAANPDGGLLINSPSYTNWHLIPPPRPTATHTVYYMNLGMISMNMPLRVRVLDPMGLAYPLAAHTFRFPGARIGHDKNLDADWAVVDAAVTDKNPAMPRFIDEGWVSRIHTAISCPRTRDLLEATRSPLTPARFARNLRMSLIYARYRIDRVPENEIQRCGLPDPPVTPR